VRGCQQLMCGWQMTKFGTICRFAYWNYYSD